MQSVDLKELGVNAATIHHNASASYLVSRAIERGEGTLTDRGALAVKTGKYTGRSPKDKFIVDTKGVHNLINWGDVNRPISRKVFDEIKGEMLSHLDGKEVFVFDGFAGADASHRRKFRIINDCAWQNLFIHNMLVRPTDEELDNFGDADYTILAVPSYKCDPERFGIHSEAAIIIDYEAHFAIIAGTSYAGEIKKTVFSIMNFVLPIEDGVLPMHCSSNMDPVTGETAIFFGLSGTGKTTLSADPARKLIGDDEHGWTDTGVFNIEGGCYAKCIDLKESEQPEIYDAVKFGAVTENVILDDMTGAPDYADRTLTENTRVCYPIEHISNVELYGKGGLPKAVIFLTADAFGVLPPISRLSREAAMYQFITGFTSKLAGTERGIKDPKPTFSTLFGEPFMPLAAEKYAKMLGERLDKYGTKVYLVNTGWTGGSYGKGSRIKLKYTRAMITAALNGELENATYHHDELFNLDIPTSVTGVPSELLNPRDTWKNKSDYDATALKLASMFEENFQNKYPNISKSIAAAGPHVENLAETAAV